MTSLYEQLGNINEHSHSPEFLDFLEMHMAVLRAASIDRGEEVVVSENDRVRADKNFNLFCNIGGVPFNLHWLTLRINGYREYSKFRYNDRPIYKVDVQKLGELKLKYDESQSIT